MSGNDMRIVSAVKRKYTVLDFIVIEDEVIWKT